MPKDLRKKRLLPPQPQSLQPKPHQVRRMPEHLKKIRRRKGAKTQKLLTMCQRLRLCSKSKLVHDVVYFNLNHKL